MVGSRVGDPGGSPVSNSVDSIDRAGYATRMTTTPDDPAAAIAAVIGLRRLADRMEREAVERAVDDGWTWQQIAQALGVTRQAAHKRHAARIRHRARPTEDGR
jgi:FixJ family two-component response regulator